MQCEDRVEMHVNGALTVSGSPLLCDFRRKAHVIIFNKTEKLNLKIKYDFTENL